MLILGAIPSVRHYQDKENKVIPNSKGTNDDIQVT